MNKRGGLFFALLLILSLSLLLSACAADEPQSQCRLEISCANALSWEGLDPALAEQLPEGGAVLSVDAAFAAGETAYDVLTRALREAGVHYEVGDGNTYFLAVNNLYSGDCGDLSGWMYSVNDEFPLDAVNQYQVQEGDVIVLAFTCDMGADLGYVFEGQ